MRGGEISQEGGAGQGPASYLDIPLNLGLFSGAHRFGTKRRRANALLLCDGIVPPPREIGVAFAIGIGGPVTPPNLPPPASPARTAEAPPWNRRTLAPRLRWTAQQERRRRCFPPNSPPWKGGAGGGCAAKTVLLNSPQYARIAISNPGRTLNPVHDRGAPTAKGATQLSHVGGCRAEQNGNY